MPAPVKAGAGILMVLKVGIYSPATIRATISVAVCT